MELRNKMGHGYLSQSEIDSIGFKSVGKNVLISSKACFYIPEKISLGNNVRIDDFCIIIGNVQLGDYIHIAAYTSIHASYGSIVIGDYSTLSSRVTLYAVSDDYSGETMTSSIIDDEYKNLSIGHIEIGKFVIIGTGTIILEKSKIPDGVAIGAVSLVNKQLDSWTIYAGIPCKKIKDRSKKLLDIHNKINI